MVPEVAPAQLCVHNHQESRNGGLRAGLWVQVFSLRFFEGLFKGIYKGSIKGGSRIIGLQVRVWNVWVSGFRGSV